MVFKEKPGSTEMAQNTVLLKLHQKYLGCGET